MMLFALLTLKLTLKLIPLSFTLFSLSMRHLLSVSLQHLAFSRVSLTVTVQLRRRVLHRLADSRK
jgi:hypothetical protein